jgi:inositol 3-alpha-galactosyltransferase
MAIPRTLRAYLIAALGLMLFPLIYFSSGYQRLPYLDGGLIGHKHALSDVEEVSMVFPYDPIPRRDFASLAKYPAHNIEEPSKNVFATFYCSRQPDLRGPYFEATQSIIWRLLWSEYRSKYPLIVFVCPFIPYRNRRIFEGQGAIVKEIELLDDIIPDEAIATKRWIDVLSKLNIWRETDWQMITFLDSDAFPVRNIDDIFNLVPIQRCKEDELSPEDKAVVQNGFGGDDMCNYIYAGVSHFNEDNVNAGMLVLKPNLDMHRKLIKAARRTDDYDIKEMEQGILRSKNAFDFDGPFPVNRLPKVWNGLPEYYMQYRDKGLESVDGPVRILHAKWWNRLWGQWNNLTELNDQWDLDWMKMCRFYDEEGTGFVEARKTGVYKTPMERYLESQKST